MGSRTWETRLAALTDAAGVLAGELDLDTVLDVIVRSAAHVTGAQYAALGVLGVDESIARFITHGDPPGTVEAIGHYPTGQGLLGLLIRDPRVLRLDDLRDHPASAGFPPGHPPMTSFLGAPVRSRGQVFGNLYLTDKPGGFEPADEQLIEVLAAQAGAAIESAQLHGRLQQLAVQDERDRISRELHDGVIQSLFSIGMGLESARALLPEGADAVNGRLESAVDSLDAAIRELRAAIFRLRPQQAASLGLTGGLTELAREYEVNALIRPELSLPTGLDAQAPTHVVPDVLALVREALSNVARHADASHVAIRVALGEAGMEVSVVDDGRGFPGGTTAGHGLENMHERAEALGGEVQVRSQPGHGTAVWLLVPTKEETHHGT